MRIAVIGSGVAGLGAAWALSRSHDVTLYEREARLGGHARTVDVVSGNELVAVDTGFIVYNERTYPNLTALLAYHQIATRPSDMSLSVSDGEFEFSPTADAMLASPGTALSRRGRGIMRGIVRLGSELRRGMLPPPGVTIGDHLRASGYPAPFVDDYLLPLTAAVWSASTVDASRMPAATLLRFFANHGLFELPRPQWRTVAGGSREYVERLSKEVTRVMPAAEVTSVRRLADGVEVSSDDGTARFDQVVLATHAPTSLSLLADATPLERSILGRFRYESNRAVLHRDERFMPQRRRVWASWNATIGREAPGAPVAITYWMNRLQGIDDRHPLFVTLNPQTEPGEVLDEVWFSHPQFGPDTDRAQAAIPLIQGVGGVWHCGAWLGHGFHEDGLQAGLTVATALGSPAPWHVEPASPAAVHAAPARPR